MGKFPPLWLRHGFPTICFCLGTWQVYRLSWKNEMISKLQENLGRSAVKLESIPDDIESIRYRRVKLYGGPDPTIPIFVGPRGARDIEMGTPPSMEILNFRTRILLDYGRVPIGKEGAIKIPTTDTYVEAILEEPERKSFFIPENDPKVGKWIYRDVKAMAETFSTEPLLFQRTSRKLNTSEIPIVGPPKISIPNKHFEYVLTWYGMAITTFALGFLRR